MESAIRRMDAQLTHWGAKIALLAAKKQSAGDSRSPEVARQIGVLRALHQVARSNFDKFRAAEVEDRAALRAGVTQACEDLAVALKQQTGSR